MAGTYGKVKGEGKMKKNDTKKSFRMAAGIVVILLAAGVTVYLSWHSGTKDSGTEKEVSSELPEFPEETVNDSQEDISVKDTPEKNMQIGIVGKEKVQDMSVTFEETGEASLKEVDMISMTGLAGSPESNACAEYQEFLASYDEDEEIISSIGNEETGIGEEYEAYSCYTQEMADKIDEICGKYGLIKKTGFQLAENYDKLCEGTGIGDFLGTPSEEMEMDYTDSYYYADGSFQASASAIGAGFIVDCQISRHAKGTFDETVLNVGNIEESRQWTYKTKCGTTVLLANNGTTKALILADLEKSFMAVNVLGNLRTNTFDVSDEMLEEMADFIDFSVIP